jgi:hypothetical protein
MCLRSTIRNEVVEKLNIIGNASLDESWYVEDYYFLPSLALKRIFEHNIKSGKFPNEQESRCFCQIFPCPEESVKSKLRKQIDVSLSKCNVKERQRVINHQGYDNRRSI